MPLLHAVAIGDKSIVDTLLKHPLDDDNTRLLADLSLLKLAVRSGSKDMAWLVAEQIAHN